MSLWLTVGSLLLVVLSSVSFGYVIGHWVGLERGLDFAQASISRHLDSYEKWDWT